MVDVGNKHLGTRPRTERGPSRARGHRSEAIVDLDGFVKIMGQAMKKNMKQWQPEIFWLLLIHMISLYQLHHSASVITEGEKPCCTCLGWAVWGEHPAIPAIWQGYFLDACEDQEFWPIITQLTMPNNEPFDHLWYVIYIIITKASVS